MELVLNREAGEPLYRQIAERISEMIRLGALAPGVRLPGSRALADSLGISRCTAQSALNLLIDQGLVVSRLGSGHYVVGQLELPVFSRSVIDLDSHIPQGRMMPQHWMEQAGQGLFESSQAFDFSPVEGAEELRRLLAGYAVRRGLAVDWRNLFVGGGGRQAISVTLALWRSRGVRRCWCPQVCWNWIQSAAQMEGLQLCRFQHLDDLEQLTEQDGVYLNPTFSNPTGQTLNHQERQLVAQRSSTQGFWVLEDDAYGDLRWGDVVLPALTAYGGERMTYVGSLSQTFCPSLRVGFTVYPNHCSGFVADLHQRRFGPLSSLLQAWTARFLSCGLVDKALAQIREEGRLRMQSLWGVLGDLIDTEAPQGGIYLWLPVESGDLFASEALKQGVAVTPGRLFSDGVNLGAVRLSIAACEQGQLERGGKILRQLIQRQRGRF